MNATYQRYLNDEEFRASIHAAARRERSRILARFFSRIFGLNGKSEVLHAASAHLARQG
jgi:hypothetical protein